MWTQERAEQQRARRLSQRRGRFLEEVERYVRDTLVRPCGTQPDLLAAWTRFVLSRMPEVNLMGCCTFPERFGAAWRRRWVFDEFLGEWLGEGRFLSAQEPHQSGDLHFHFVGSAREVRRLSMMDAWHQRTGGGRARIEEPRNLEEAVGYCVKYVAKSYLSVHGELNLGPGFGRAV